jgi:Glucosamine-6-phosphate isomerases/6-phosphogluconolactonase
MYSSEANRERHGSTERLGSSARPKSPVPALSPTMNSSVRLVIAPSAATLADKLSRDIASLARRCIGARGVFLVAMSGGSMPKLLSQLAAVQDMEWDKWQIFLCDERCVPEDDPASTILVSNTFSHTSMLVKGSLTT